MPEHKITQVMMDDKTIDASKEIAMVFSIANTLRGPYKPDQYKEVIIPMQEIGISVLQHLRIRSYQSAH